MPRELEYCVDKMCGDQFGFELGEMSFYGSVLARC